MNGYQESLMFDVAPAVNPITLTEKKRSVTPSAIKSRKYRAKHPYNDSVWRDGNREKIRQQARNFYSNHIEEQRKRSVKKYNKLKTDHPEVIKVRLEWGRNQSKTPCGIFNSYKKAASKRGLSFEITLEQFAEFIGRPCVYCGDIARGVDRVENSKGYTIENMASCCGKCNHMKRHWSKEEFITHCKKVSRNIPDPNEPPADF